MSAAQVGSEVWILDFSAEGPEPGDYDGWQSVHASREGASDKLIERFIDAAVQPPGPLDVISATADNGSYAGEFETDDGVSVSYGVHRMPVEP